MASRTGRSAERGATATARTSHNGASRGPERAGRMCSQRRVFVACARSHRMISPEFSHLGPAHPQAGPAGACDNYSAMTDLYRVAGIANQVVGMFSLAAVLHRCPDFLKQDFAKHSTCSAPEVVTHSCSALDCKPQCRYFIGTHVFRLRRGARVDQALVLRARRLIAAGNALRHTAHHSRQCRDLDRGLCLSSGCRPPPRI